MDRAQQRESNGMIGTTGKMQRRILNELKAGPQHRRGLRAEGKGEDPSVHLDGRGPSATNWVPPAIPSVNFPLLTFHRERLVKVGNRSLEYARGPVFLNPGLREARYENGKFF